MAKAAARPWRSRPVACAARRCWSPPPPAVALRALQPGARCSVDGAQDACSRARRNVSSARAGGGEKRVRCGSPAAGPGPMPVQVMTERDGMDFGDGDGRAGVGARRQATAVSSAAARALARSRPWRLCVPAAWPLRAPGHAQRPPVFSSLCVEACSSASSKIARMRALRTRAVRPPKTTATTCFPPRWTEATRLKPDARV